MKALIKSVTFTKEFETKFGMMYGFKVVYDDKTAYYSSKSKEQKNFIEGQESEFVEEEKESNGKKFLTIKPVPKNPQSNYGRQVKKEQSRYSGFAVSYVKDLIIAGRVDIKDWEKESEKIFNFMVKLDKTLEQ